MRIVAPHFVAGVVFVGDHVVRAAPILKWSIGWNRIDLIRYCDRKGWKAEHMTTHIMTDTETLGTRVGSVILSVAFVRFADEASMSVNLSVPEQQALGLEVDPDTVAWWHKREAETPGLWAQSTGNAVSLAHALPYISQWLAWASGNGDKLIWCHGATFDCPLLGELFRRAGVPCPWDYWQVRDTRTLYDLAAINVKDYPVPPPHVALNDAISQVRAANAALRILSRAHQVPA